MKKIILFSSVAVFLLLMVSGCADAIQPEMIEGAKVLPLEESPYGFFSGLWHGMIVFFSFWGSLFSDDIAVYAVNNSGGWYDFGFMLGSGIFGGSASTTVSR